MPDLSSFDLTGKKALVTGAARGIGRGAALALARAGADVAIVDLDETYAAQATAVVRSLGVDTAFMPCDVTDQSQVKAMVATVVERFGRLDIAINNAGTFRPGDDLTAPKADWDAVIGVNLTAVWLCAQAEAQQMTSQVPVGGKIVNIGSVGAATVASNASYDASKAGVVHLSRTLAARWGGHNINVNAVSPGYVGTAFGSSRGEEDRARLRSLTPLGWIQRTTDLAGAIVFLASEASDFVTGQNLVVDGGLSLGAWVVPLERFVPARVSPDDEVE